jgi:exopolysaccharide biosynthesis predicted pyruvyltransferase EpsI
MPSVGDHAQLYALEQFLAEKFSDYQVVKLYRSDLELMDKLKVQVQPNDLIFISSSGDFGDRYAYSGWHDTRKKIINTFKNNRVIQLPVSMCYVSNCNFEVDKSFFCNLPHFTLLCRTPENAEMLKANFNCDVRFFPDFVFYLKPAVKNCSRDGALVVMRKDDEACFAPVNRINVLMDKLVKYGLAGRAVNKVLRTLGYGNYVYQNDVLINEIKRSCQPVCFKDVMVSDCKVTDESRKNLIKSLFELFSQYKVVVTDRFHAAVFAMLTGTPCVALPTGIKDKIKGCIQLLPNTLYTDSLKALPDTV